MHWGKAGRYKKDPLVCLKIKFQGVEETEGRQLLPPIAQVLIAINLLNNGRYHRSVIHQTQ